MIPLIVCIVFAVIFTPLMLHQLYYVLTGGDGSWAFIGFGIFWLLALGAQIRKLRCKRAEARRIGFSVDDKKKD